MSDEFDFLTPEDRLDMAAASHRIQIDKQQADIEADPILKWRKDLSASLQSVSVKYEWDDSHKLTSVTHAHAGVVHVPDEWLEYMFQVEANPVGVAHFILACLHEPRLTPWDSDGWSEE